MKITKFFLSEGGGGGGYILAVGQDKKKTFKKGSSNICSKYFHIFVLCFQ